MLKFQVILLNGSTDFGTHQPLNYCSVTVKLIVRPKMEFLSSCSFKPINVKEKMFSLEYNAHSFNFDSPWKCSMDCVSQKKARQLSNNLRERNKSILGWTILNEVTDTSFYQLISLFFPPFLIFSVNIKVIKSSVMTSLSNVVSSVFINSFTILNN